MKTVLAPFRQLVARRLWPVALLLVVAVVAVPRLLAEEDPAATSVATAAPVEGADPLNDEDVVSLAGQDVAERRRVLGARKDPFEPAPAPKKKTAKTASTAKPAPQSESSAPTTPSGGGGGTSVPSVPPVTEPSLPDPPAGSVTVRFGDATSDDLPSGWLTKLRPLPDSETPLLVYMGLTKNGKKAKFLVDATLTPTGDGTCKPHPSSCETILLGRGETEFFDAIDPETGEPSAQYQLDLVAINK
jgi:hypothetical protein